MLARALIVLAAFAAIAAIPARAAELSDCLASNAPEAPQIARPFTFRITDDENDPVDPGIRCSVRRVTLAVREEGVLRDPYPDGNAPFDEGEAFQDLIDEIRRRAGENQRVRILVYAHGGMVSHENAIAHAEALAPFMMRDGYLPIFLVWNSDFPPAYIDHLCCVQDGFAGEVGALWYVPSRFFGDVVSGVGRAPETFGDQVLRFTGAVANQPSDDYAIQDEDYWRRTDLPYLDQDLGAVCAPPAGQTQPSNLPPLDQRRPYVVFPPFCGSHDLNDRGRGPTLGRVGYYATMPVRLVSTPLIQGLGSSAWDNMVRRTRLAFRAPDAFVRRLDQIDALRLSGDLIAADCVQLTAEGETLAAADKEQSTGAFDRFFARLQCEFDADATEAVRLQRPRALENVKIDLFGHSMGAIIHNEMIAHYPRLPYRRIVYMGAASSIRDFSVASAPVFELNRSVWFANLSLHPLAEARELNFAGLPPAGSLLEWVDEIFEGPRSMDDLTLGKWRNVRHTLHIFPRRVEGRAIFHVFPFQDNLEPVAFGAECVRWSPRDQDSRCHPLKHGDFNHFAFWRDCYILGRMARPTGMPADDDAAAANARCAVLRP